MEQRTKVALDCTEPQRKYPHEDRALKAAAQMLGEALVSLTELGVTIKRMIPTEQVVLHTESFMEDFNYETDTKEILHLEFESDEITKEDLMRFRGYEAVLSYQQKKDVLTCILCSSRAKELRNEMRTGMNVYRVKVIQLKDWNADEVLDAMEKKQKKAYPLNKEELLKLVLLPLMEGRVGQRERIGRGFRVLHREGEHQDKAELLKLEGVLYILAEKFLNRMELEELKEEIKVTRLGQMLFDDGWNAGIQTGAADMVLDFLKDLGTVPQWVTTVIRNTTDVNTLKTWGKLASKAESIEEFCEKAGLN